MSSAVQGDIELAISASDRLPSIALRGPDGEIRVEAPTSRTAGDLTKLIADSFERWGHQPGQLRAIRLDLGPGSYTGLRVAVTFARTARQFQGVTVHTCTSLQLIALSALCAGMVTDGDQVRPVLDARRQRFHHALVATDGLQVLEAPAAVGLDELRSRIQEREVLLAAQPLHEVLAATVSDRGARLIAPPPWNAKLLFDDRLNLAATESVDLEPLYLMGSYAEQRPDTGPNRGRQA